MPISTAEDEVKSNANSEYSYDRDFLSKEEADALFAVAQSLPRERPLNKLSGFKYGLRRLQMPCYSATPNWRGSENEKTNQWMMALDEAPAEVKSLADKLSKLAGKPVNYFSFVGYLSGEPAPIPWQAMYGKMKEWAQQTELSMSVAYPAILAAYSAIPKYDDILGVRFNLYAALLMPVGGGKNLALDRAAQVLHMVAGTDFQDCTLGGAGGLWQALGEKKESRGRDATVIPGPQKMLLNPAEFGATLANTRIDGSTLSQHLCNLWDKNKITLPTREGVRGVDCRLSILGALPVDSESLEQFSRFFAEEASHGLYSRFIFGYSTEQRDNRWAERWQMKAVGDEIEDLVPTMPATIPPTGWDPDAENFYSNINLPDDRDGRGLYNLKRIALLSATANGDKLVTQFCVQCAWFFMLWQAQLKRSFTVRPRLIQAACYAN